MDCGYCREIHEEERKFPVEVLGEKSMDGRFYVKVNVCEKLFAGHVVGFNLSLSLSAKRRGRKIVSPLKMTVCGCHKV